MEGGALDCGRVIYQEHFDLDENATITDVYRWAEETTPELFVRALDSLNNDESYMLKYADPKVLKPSVAIRGCRKMVL